MLKIIDRYLFATVGLFLVALGTSLSAYANFGIAPLSSLAYVFNLKYPSISFGTFIFFVNLFYMIFQIIFYGKAFKAKYLLQLVASGLFSIFVDFSSSIIGWIPDSTLIEKFIIILAASFVTALGISMEVKSNAWMLSAEMTVASFCYRYPKAKFSGIKMWMDSILVLMTIALSFIFFKNPLGSSAEFVLVEQLLARSEGVVIGIGTIILALLPGYLVRYTDLLFNKIKL